MTVEQARVENQDIKDITLKELADLGFPMIKIVKQNYYVQKNCSEDYLGEGWYPVETCRVEDNHINCPVGR